MHRQIAKKKRRQISWKVKICWERCEPMKKTMLAPLALAFTLASSILRKLRSRRARMIRFRPTRRGRKTPTLSACRLICGAIAATGASALSNRHRACTKQCSSGVRIKTRWRATCNQTNKKKKKPFRKAFGIGNATTEDRGVALGDWPITGEPTGNFHVNQGHFRAAPFTVVKPIRSSRRFEQNRR
jgi:hypothetical protein